MLLDLSAAGQTLIIVTQGAELIRRHARRVIHLASAQTAPGNLGTPDIPACTVQVRAPLGWFRPRRRVLDQDAMAALFTSVLRDFFDGRGGSAGRGDETEDA